MRLIPAHRLTTISLLTKLDDLVKPQSCKECARHVSYMALVRKHWDTINDVKHFLLPVHGPLENQPHVTNANILLDSIPTADKFALWKAPTKGGVFTTNERFLLKTPPEEAL